MWIIPPYSSVLIVLMLLIIPFILENDFNSKLRRLSGAPWYQHTGLLLYTLQCLTPRAASEPVSIRFLCSRLIC